MTFSSHVDKAMPGNWTPLHFAAALHRFDVCDWILEEGCWSDMVTIGHETPLTLVGVRYFLPFVFRFLVVYVITLDKDV